MVLCAGIPKIYAIEKMLNNFSRLLSLRANSPKNFPNHDYSIIMSGMNFIYLEAAVVGNDLLFVFTLFNNKINCQILTNYLEFFYKPHNEPRPRKFSEYLYC